MNTTGSKTAVRTDQAPARAPLLKIVRSLLRAAGAIAVLTTIYYLLPLDHASAWFAGAILVSGLALLTALVFFQIQSVLRSSYPALRAIESLAVSVPLFLLLFAATYMTMEGISGRSFSQPLTHTDALYFTVTVFATVGFGDITPISQGARLLVTAQMLADLVIIGIAIKAIGGAVQRRRQQG